MFYINFMTANQLPGTFFKGSLMLQFCSCYLNFFYSSAENDVISAALFFQLPVLDSRKSVKLNHLEIYIFFSYIHYNLPRIDVYNKTIKASFKHNVTLLCWLVFKCVIMLLRHKLF